MAVTLTVSKAGARGAQISDVLAGGDAGWDLGQVVNGRYQPITDQTANTGYANIYAYHDATIDPITDVATYVDIYPGTYGGAKDAATDIADLVALGDASPCLSANNGTGLEGGFRIDHRGRALAALPTRFDPTEPAVRVYGKTGVGVDLASAIPVHVDAMNYYNGGAMDDAGTPVAGTIGKLGDATLGDTAWLGARFYLPTAAADGGIIQWAWVWAYSYTA